MSSEASKNSDESRDFEYMLYLHPDVHLDGTTADDRAQSVFNLDESSKEQLKIKSEKADETGKFSKYAQPNQEIGFFLENQTNSTEANSALNHAYSNSQLAISQASLKCRSVQNPLLNEQPKQKNGKHFLLNELTTRFARPRSCCSGGERISRGGRPSVTWKSHLAAYGSRGMASSFQTVNYSNEQMFSKHVRTEKNNSSVYCTPNAAQSNYFASLDAFFEYIAEYSLKAQKTLEMHEEFTSAKSSLQSYKDQNSNAKIQTNADGTNQTFTNEIRRLIVKCTEKNCPFFIKIT